MTGQNAAENFLLFTNKNSLQKRWHKSKRSLINIMVMIIHLICIPDHIVFKPNVLRRSKNVKTKRNFCVACSSRETVFNSFYIQSADVPLDAE